MDNLFIHYHIHIKYYITFILSIYLYILSNSE